MKKNIAFYSLMSLATLGVMAGPVAIANFIFGYILGDAPCTSCWALRINMIVVSLGALFIVRYGLKMKYIAMIMMVSAFGIWNAFWHLGWYAQLDIGQGQALAIFNLHTQIWAGIVFWAVILILGLILIFTAPSFEELAQDFKEQSYRILSKLDKVAFIVFFVVVASNALQAFIAVGPPPYTGQDSPARFTFNPKYNKWETLLPDLFADPSFHGPFGVDAPDLPSDTASYMQFNHDSASSPLKIEKELKIVSKKDISLNLNGAISGLRYNQKTNSFAVVTQDWGMYLVNKDFNKIENYLVLDNFYFPFITNLVGVDFLSDGSIKMMGSNKAYAVAKFDSLADEVAGFANLKEGADKFTVSDRNMFRTVRANTHYINDAVSDSKYTYTISVPSNLENSFVLIKQLNADGLLASESTPEVANNLLKKDGDLGSLYVTGLALKDGLLYAASKNFNTIVVIDTKTDTIINTLSYPNEITNLRGITFVGDDLYAVSYQNDKNTLFILK